VRGRDGARELADLDEVLSALAHPSRRHVLVVLKARGGAMPAGEVARRFSCSWPTTSRHLRVLEDAGLVTARRRGRHRLLALSTRRLGALRAWLAWLEARPRRRERGPGRVG
jgi:DNA-binding transcriptional ArsR family regulator